MIDLPGFGVKARITHHRYGERTGMLLPRSLQVESPQAKGGMTTAVLFREDGQATGVIGVARCSRLDNYNKKLGRLIAIGRALKEYASPSPLDEDVQDIG